MLLLNFFLGESIVSRITPLILGSSPSGPTMKSYRCIQKLDEVAGMSAISEELKISEIFSRQRTMLKTLDKFLSELKIFSGPPNVTDIVELYEKIELCETKAIYCD